MVSDISKFLIENDYRNGTNFPVNGDIKVFHSIFYLEKTCMNPGINSPCELKCASTVPM